MLQHWNYLYVAVSLGIVDGSKFSGTLPVFGVRCEHAPSALPLTANHLPHLQQKDIMTTVL